MVVFGLLGMVHVRTIVGRTAVRSPNDPDVSWLACEAAVASGLESVRTAVPPPHHAPRGNAHRHCFARMQLNRAILAEGREGVRYDVWDCATLFGFGFIFGQHRRSPITRRELSLDADGQRVARVVP